MAEKKSLLLGMVVHVYEFKSPGGKGRWISLGLRLSWYT